MKTFSSIQEASKNLKSQNDYCLISFFASVCYYSITKDHYKKPSCRWKTYYVIEGFLDSKGTFIQFEISSQLIRRFLLSLALIFFSKRKELTIHFSGLLILDENFQPYFVAESLKPLKWQFRRISNFTKGRSPKWKN